MKTFKISSIQNLYMTCGSFPFVFSYFCLFVSFLAKSVTSLHDFDEYLLVSCWLFCSVWHKEPKGCVKWNWTPWTIAHWSRTQNPIHVPASSTLTTGIMQELCARPQITKWGKLIKYWICKSICAEDYKGSALLNPQRDISVNGSYINCWTRQTSQKATSALLRRWNGQLYHAASQLSCNWQSLKEPLTARAVKGESVQLWWIGVTAFWCIKFRLKNTFPYWFMRHSWSIRLHLSNNWTF